MTIRKSRIATFVAELRRRQVLRVLGFYAISVFAVLQIADIVAPALFLPDWFMTVLVVTVTASFPLVAALAWVFDITPDGIIRTPKRSTIAVDEMAFDAVIAENPRLWIDIVVIAILLGIVAYLLVRPSVEVISAKNHILAVQPFDDRGDGGEDIYLASGLTEALIDDLVRIPGIQVVARTSARAIGRDDIEPQALGELLGANLVLTGSVQRTGRRVRVSARRVAVDTGHHLWADSFDRTIDDVASLQSSISRAIARALRVKIGVDEVAPDRIAGDAYALYLQGRGALRQEQSTGSIEYAIAKFEEALRIDPRLALADAGLCTAYVEQYQLTSQATLMSRALEACNSARDRDDSLPEVNAALGWVYEQTGRIEQAREAYERAVALDPANGDAWRGIGAVELKRGDPVAAEKAMRRSVELEPAFWRSYTALGGLLIGLGRHEEATQVFERAIERIPGNAPLYRNLGAVNIMLTRWEAAMEANQRSIALVPTYRAYSNLGTSYFYLGRYTEAREAYRMAIELAPEDYRPRTYLADTCRQLPGGAACADEQERIALQLATEQLRINPADAMLRARIALIHARLGAIQEADAGIARALHEAPDNYEVLRYAAIISLIKGERDRAAGYLATALERGFPVSLAAGHPDFAPLRGHPALESKWASL